MSALLDRVLDDVEKKAAQWERMVAEQRAVTTVNPPADAVEYCAKDLRVLVQRIRENTEELTPEQYARQQGVSAETVRAWIRRGRLAFRTAGRGYLIPRDAKPAPAARQAS
jgi:excisionase family DNA binding protein